MSEGAENGKRNEGINRMFTVRNADRLIADVDDARTCNSNNTLGGQNMIQELKTNITIQIPENYVLVKKVEYEELNAMANNTYADGMSWLIEQTGIKSPGQLKEKILYPYRSELEDFISYPERTGEVWRFNTMPMKKWLQENFKKVVR